MNPLDIVLIIVFSILYMWSLYNIPILVAGVKSLLMSGQEMKKTPKSNEKELLTFSIIVPAKDEERVLGRLLNALLKLDYPQDKKEIIVVEDGSIDKTADICAEFSGQRPRQDWGMAVHAFQKI